jgi:15-cis-phytoene synthase
MLPSSLEAPLAAPSDYRICRAAIAEGSRSFYVASKLLPSWVRRPAYGLYAFCRLSDDAVDLGDGSIEALIRLKDRLARAGDGRPLPFAADRAMADLMRRHAVPRAIPEALIEGLAWDVEGRRYETLEDLHAYAARVAGTVGVMMALLMGARSDDALARACDLGVAMQLTNIARDVGEDARSGRVYLPLAWLRTEGVEVAAMLAEPQADERLKRVVARLLAEADGLYARALSGVAQLPRSCRAGILAAARIYAEIGRAVERNGLDSVLVRARVGGGRKLALLAGAWRDAGRVTAGPPAPPLAATAFLIEAVAQSRSRPLAPRFADSVRVPVLRTVSLFERLRRADGAGG